MWGCQEAGGPIRELEMSLMMSRIFSLERTYTLPQTNLLFDMDDLGVAWVRGLERFQKGKVCISVIEGILCVERMCGLR